MSPLHARSEVSTKTRQKEFGEIHGHLRLGLRSRVQRSCDLRGGNEKDSRGFVRRHRCQGSESVRKGLRRGRARLGLFLFEIPAFVSVRGESLRLLGAKEDVVDWKARVRKSVRGKEEDSSAFEKFTEIRRKSLRREMILQVPKFSI